jgi:hypothetical protein
VCTKNIPNKTYVQLFLACVGVKSGLLSIYSVVDRSDEVNRAVDEKKKTRKKRNE